ncbi:MAG: Stage V sporulation protein E [Candidatus Jorgensenbacteria bacterium GW2011_GWF2_41_8]|nr:MAG: Stage V sporulation protein E [Candidatus Jorgensenbacteria bacterium GW2011_GWF2_41_8]
MLGLIAFGVLVYFKPYARERVTTFLNPANDPQDSSWQINQSLIAIGSGSVFGRGLGQGIQKFTYLPEPQGDSIFAVIAEELGFVGSITIILLYVVFVLRGLRIASRAPDQFGRLLSSGIVIMITVQAFLNIAALAGLVPLTGVPLPFMSHGGTSLLFSLAAVGIVLNVSRYQTKKIQT